MLLHGCVHQSDGFLTTDPEHDVQVRILTHGVSLDPESSVECCICLQDKLSFRRNVGSDDTNMFVSTYPIKRELCAILFHHLEAQDRARSHLRVAKEIVISWNQRVLLRLLVTRSI